MIAQIESIFGDPVEAIYAPDYLTVVVGIEANPVAKEGNRIVSHLLGANPNSIERINNLAPRSTSALLATLSVQRKVMDIYRCIPFLIEAQEGVLYWEIMKKRNIQIL